MNPTNSKAITSFSLGIVSNMFSFPVFGTAVAIIRTMIAMKGKKRQLFLMRSWTWFTVAELVMSVIIFGTILLTGSRVFYFY
ncbi:hypothetical protein JCM19046_3811 [Bacillus sp. JCM 19046]|nr:hypothetical protein JCM19045_1344 [Bacillus sp. JCM 19045]GAF19180.1 hypothetical protein JCM19046_3811 [Bacillus sp. JCM 19046]